MPKGFYRRTKKVSEETRRKISIKMSGKNNPMYGVTSPFKGKHHTKETKQMFSELGKKRVGKLCPGWRGGRRITRIGYVEIYSPDHPSRKSNKGVMEHRIVMEKHLGRYLERWEIVHHRNGVKDDNRIENLELVISKGGIHFGTINCPHCQKSFKIL